MDNTEILFYANLADNVYKNYFQGFMQQDLQDKGLDQEWEIVSITPHTTQDGFQGVIYAKKDSYNTETGKYGEIAR